MFYRIILCCLVLSACVDRFKNTDQEFAYKLPLISEKVPPQEMPSPQASLDEKFSYVENQMGRSSTGPRLKIAELRELLAEALAKKFGAPYYVKAQLLVAEHLEYNHQFSEAIAIATEVLRTDPQSRKSLKILATSSLAIGDKKTATQAAHKLSRIYPRTSTYALLGLIHLNSGREREGDFSLRKALQIEDVGELADSSWARSILARHYLQRNRKSEAEFLLSEALRIAPSNGFALSLLARLKLDDGAFEEARGLLEKAYLLSGQVEFLRQLADLSFHRKQLAVADELWAQVEKNIRAELQQNIFDHSTELAKVLLLRQKPADAGEALVLLSREVTLREGDEVYYLLALARYQSKDFEGARAALDRVLSSGVRDARYYKLLESISTATEDLAHASLMRELCLELTGEECAQTKVF